jgi:prophage DNA circulation protein
MYKYKNVSDFRQSMVVEGKRLLLKPDDVIESAVELKYVFLELVDSATPVSSTNATSVVKKVDVLQQRLDGLEKDKEELAVAQSKEIYDTVEEVDKGLKELQTKMADLTGIVKLLKGNIEAVSNTVQGLANASTEDKKIFVRRLEMLKSAVMTIEGEVFGSTEELGGK